MHLMNDIIRLDRALISFPPECVRCGAADPATRYQLPLPRQRWLGSNPAIKAPMCVRCFITITMFRGLSLAAVLILALAGLKLILPLVFRFWPSLLQGSSSSSREAGWIAFASIFTALEYLRSRLLRGGLNLRARITQFDGDWAEFTSDDLGYLGRIQTASLQEPGSIFKL
jgi:hypothetical protein